MSKKTFFEKVRLYAKFGSLDSNPLWKKSMKNLTLSKQDKNTSLKIFNNQELQKSIKSLKSHSIYDNRNLASAKNLTKINDINSNITKSNNNTNINNFSNSNNTDMIKIDSPSAFITLVPIKKSHSKQISCDLSQYKNQQNKNFELIAYNDENCFVSSRPKKSVSFPKKIITLKQYRIFHDINSYNLSNLIVDYMKDYEKNSYKIKKLVNDSKFLEKIKKDLISLKYDNRIKLFNE